MKSVLPDIIKWDFFQAVALSILLYGGTTWTPTKHMEKKLDGNYTKMLHAVLNKSWNQHPTKQQLYGHLPPISQTLQVSWRRRVEYCRRSKDKLISNILLCTLAHGHASVVWSVKTYLYQLHTDTDTRYSLEDLLGVIDDRDGWQESVRELCAVSVTWWWLINKYEGLLIALNKNLSICLKKNTFF